MQNGRQILSIAAIVVLAAISCHSDESIPTGPGANNSARIPRPTIRLEPSTMPAIPGGDVPRVPEEWKRGMSSTAPGAQGAATTGNGFGIAAGTVRHIMLENTATGLRAVWAVNNGQIVQAASLGTVPLEWHMAGMGDFNADALEDILWENTVTGSRAVWLMDGGAGVLSAVSLGTVPTAFRIAGAGNYGGDMQDDILWENTTTGERVLWIMSGGAVQQAATLTVLAAQWRMIAANDLNNDGEDDILLENTTTGARAVWTMVDAQITSAVSLGTVDPAWHFVGTGDFDYDEYQDILLDNVVTGVRALWLMFNMTVQSAPVLTVEQTAWRLTGVLAPRVQFIVNGDLYPQTVIGNVSVNSANIPFSVTDNDPIPPAASVTFAGWSSIAGATQQGGTVTMTPSGAGRGRFTYNPPRGFTGTDRFEYAVEFNGVFASTFVELNVSGMVWFVNNNPGACSANCDGRLSNPYTTLAAFDAANDGIGTNPGNGHTIFLYESATAYLGPVTVRVGQNLIGQDASSSLATIFGVTPPSGSAAFPAMNTAGAVTTIAGASGGVVIANNGIAVLRGFTIATTGGTALTNAGPFQFLIFANGTSPDVTINASGGPALMLNSGSVFGALASVSSNGGAAGVSLSFLSGSLGMGGGTLTSIGGAAFAIDGGTANITYAGNISKSSNGNVVRVTNKPSGLVNLQGDLECTGGNDCGILAANNFAVIQFSGGTKSLATGANFGVALNAGGAVQFTGGGLAITTTTGTGISAGNGGGIEVSGGRNTITVTSTGTAIFINGTAITGAEGMTFRTISTAGGGANGIVLINTGNTAGLSVIGNAGACTLPTPTCTGGTIGGTIGADGAIAGNGIYLSNTVTPSFQLMRINGTHQNHGIYGNTVTGLVLTSVLMNGVYGTNAAADEGCVSLDNFSGNVTWTGNHFAGGGALNTLRINNGTEATLNRLFLTATTLAGANTNAHLSINVTGGTTNVGADHVSFQGGEDANVDWVVSGGTAVLDLVASTFSKSPTNGGFRNIRGRFDGTPASNATISYAFLSNVLTGSHEAAIHLAKNNGTHNITGTITGNSIGGGNNDNGSVLGPGILIEHVSSGKHKSLISVNQIRQYNGLGGIAARTTALPAGGTANGSMHLTITSNVIENPGTSPTQFVDGIHLLPAFSSGDNYTVCVNVGNGAGKANNIVNAGGASPPHIQPGEPFSVGPVNSGGGWLKIVGLTGGPFTGSAANTPITARFRADNGGLASGGFVNISSAAFTTTSSADGVGVTCDMF